MIRLKNLGFNKIGSWTKVDSGIKFLLTDHQDDMKVLYSFVSNGKVMYIGKTTQSLTRRMLGYQNPGPTQRTNIRVSKEILQRLNEGLPIDIYILPDPCSLEYGGIGISLAGGLEDPLIDLFRPAWNKLGNKANYSTPERHKKSRTHHEKPQDIDSNSFEVILSPTYYNQGFFNVRKKYSDRLGKDKDPIKILLGHEPNRFIPGVIDRHANNNGSPRILGRKPFKEWIKKNFNQGDVFVVEILSPNSIKLN